MNLKCLLRCSILAVITRVVVMAADVTTNAPTSLEALAAEALSRNPELRFYEAEITAARSASRTAGLLPPPEITGSVGQKRSTDLGGRLAGEGVAWSVGVSQTFEWPGRLGLRKAIANRDLTLAQMGLDRFRTALGARVRGQALALAGAIEKARAAREVADRFRALRDVLVQRDPAGVTPQLEVRILEATELNLRRRATSAELTQESSRQELNQLLGRPVDAPLVVLNSEPSLRPAPELSALLGAAQTNNFELRLRAVELEQQGFRVALARNERWPAFSVGPQFIEENSDGRDRIVSVGVSFPLPLWRNNAASVEGAKARQIQAETMLGLARRDVERRIATSARAYATKLAEMANWRADSVKQFADATDLADRHFRLGAVPATIYVELQKQYLDAVEALLDTRSEAAAAAAELEELTGLNLVAQP